jgi:hypothetical protein
MIPTRTALQVLDTFRSFRLCHVIVTSLKTADRTGVDASSFGNLRIFATAISLTEVAVLTIFLETRKSTDCDFKS